MFSNFYLHDSDVLALARQRGEQLAREAARARLAQMVEGGQAKARRRFFRMYWIRKFLFRLSSRLAYKLAMSDAAESAASSGGDRNHVGQ